MGIKSVAGIVAAVFGASLLVGAGPVAPAAAAETLTFNGFGFGHGRGMGQYGALGYAVDHDWSTSQILGHFYGGTALRADAGNPGTAVELVRRNGMGLEVAGADLRLGGVPAGAGAVRLARSGSSLTYSTGPGCGGPWTVRGIVGSGAQVTSGTGDQLRLCEDGSDTLYRGSLRSTVVGEVQYTINDVAMQDYLRGVVPREAPASWAGLGGGRGARALDAQAVAARSYALAPRAGPRASGATTCDTTACQVYGGSARVADDGTVTSLEDARTDAAVARTAGQVMRDEAGRIALTEFSSSTGGYSAGGRFPAVVDEGDDTSANPNHTWTVTLSVADVAARLGVGSLASVQVVSRNGLGAMGGRARTVEVRSGSGAVITYTGAEVRSRLGLKSDWFAVSGFTPVEARAVTTALYADLLGRAPDPGGLESWSGYLVAGGSQTALVSAITASEEYVRLRVHRAYREVLLREPDSGAEGWVAAVRQGRLGVDDVQLIFYQTEEFYQQSGGTDRAFVAHMYDVMLGRAPSAGDLDFWTARVQSVGRANVVRNIWFSMEAAMRRTGAYYRTFLQREPDWNGQVGWAQLMLARGEGAVRVGIAGSAEYRILAVYRYPV